MRRSALGLFALLVHVAAPTAARADDRAEAVKRSAEGLELARAGAFADAVVKFKEADRLAPTAANDCNIALAYMRLEELGRAELFVQRCKQRWVRENTKGLPAWVANGHLEIENKLKAGEFGQVLVSTEPLAARVSTDLYGADEWLESPATLWLPVGEVTIKIEARRAGHKPQTMTVSVARATLGRVLVKLTADEAATETDVVKPRADVRDDIDVPLPSLSTQLPPPADEVGEREPKTVAWVLAGSGAALLAGGVVVHALAIGAKRDAEVLPAGAAFDDAEGRFSRYRTATLGLYATGAVVTAVAGYLLFLRPERATLGASVSGEGAAVSIEWTLP